MVEVLGQGDDRPPRRSPAGLLTGGIAVVLLAGVALAAVRDDRGRPEPAPTPTAGLPSPAVTPSPFDPGRLRRVPLPTLRQRTGLTLALTGERVVRVDLDRRERTPVTPRHPAGWELLPVRGGVVAVGRSEDTPATPAGPVYYVATSGPARAIGTATSVAAAVDPGHVWFVNTSSGVTRLRERNRFGRPVGPELRLRGSYLLVRETRAGLLVKTRRFGTHLLADRRSGALREAPVDDVIAVTADVAVRADGCAPCRAVVVTPLDGGPERRLALPRAIHVAKTRAVVSPGGRRIALFGHVSADVRRPEAYVVDLDANRVLRIPGELPAYGSTAAWSRDGKRLVTTLDTERGTTVVVLDLAVPGWRAALRNLPYGGGVVVLP